MKERPILFSGEMVRAILEGRKTQTRRVVKPQPLYIQAEMYKGKARPHYLFSPLSTVQWFPIEKIIELCPYGEPGGRLWVRESTWLQSSDDEGRFNLTYLATEDQIEFKTWPIPSPYKAFRKVVPSIHMPRWASRITLEISDVRVERVQDISGMDASLEGIELDFPGGHNGAYKRARQKYASLWDSINAKRGFSWDSNPWVWVIEFEVVK